MNRIYLAFTISIFSLFSLGASAAELEIVSCNLDLNHGQFTGQLKLTVDDSGKLVGWSGEMNAPLERSDDVKVYAVEPVASDLAQVLADVNQNRATGIDPAQVTHIQRIFIRGNSDFHSDLYKVFDANGKFLGWLASAIGMSGCY